MICKGIPKVPIHMKAAVVVIVGGDADSEPFFVGIGPQVSSLTPAEAPTFGNFWVDVNGHNFGLKRDPYRPPIVSIDNKPCRETQWKSESLLRCLTPVLEAGTHEVTAVVQGHSSNATAGAKIVVEEPIITEIRPKTGPAYGGATIEIHGKHLGLKNGPKEWNRWPLSMVFPA